MDFTLSARSESFRQRVQDFIEQQVLPIEQAHFSALERKGHLGDFSKWAVSEEVERLKAQAKAEGLWNLFLADPDHGAGLSTLEYAPLAEEMGRSFLAPEIFNCSAPDTGNMEVLHLFGTAMQKATWLMPLLNGDIRSVFCMTEPNVASSDATNIASSIAEDGDFLVLNGKKWWTTGLGHPKAQVGIFMGVSDAGAERHRRHSMVLFPLSAPGVSIRRMLSVFSQFDEPSGHGEVWFDQVRVPKNYLIGSLGDGFSIAQARLGPGRIHHCMRAIGAAERALGLMIARGQARTAFHQPLLKLGGNLERIANLRMAIDSARLMTLHAAWKIDTVGAMQSMKEISAIKVLAPQVLQDTVDEAIQLFGGEGLCQDSPLPALFAMARALRIVDGPDAVHRALIARLELAATRNPR
jgi:acyl-CoA dehydrogenase